MSVAVIVLGLALLWAAMTGSFSGLNLLLGAAIGTLAVLLLRKSLAQPRAVHKLRMAVSLAGLFLRELALSAVRVAIVVLTPNLKSALHPEIVAFPLSVRSDAEITLLANLITLTPGTLSIDVSADRSVLYVHVLTASTSQNVIVEIANGFEARVRELFA
ncbi:multicomponent Na+:H+ antiporter subunit E [Devosia sp. YR412]|uniref:Na+/H+ antiporter subunit E n=1 Tax=Devosia sp. YR412 TaxID=1881030 RepID=UPI0008BFF05B|nr:Na+/H+ antiporter subunit E [Devosia sp. YR412]SEP77758.1 multicomponent Na+:H+ antiporter subunit E [Devosia sp. YR412]